MKRKLSPFQKWLRTEEGKSASDISTLKSPAEMQVYLENRLQRAFWAGQKLKVRNSK